MKTAMMEHIKWLHEVIDIADAQQTNIEVIQALEYVIKGAEAKLQMEKEQIEENMAKAITFGWELSHYHRFNTEEKLLQMQKDFITSVIEGGEQ